MWGEEEVWGGSVGHLRLYNPLLAHSTCLLQDQSTLVRHLIQDFFEAYEELMFELHV